MYEADNGHDAINRLRQLNFDAVVLDINLPDMNGLEVLKRIRTEWPKLPVLILSVKTISTHRHHILSKMKMHNNADIVSYAQLKGLFEQP